MEGNVERAAWVVVVAAVALREGWGWSWDCCGGGWTLIDVESSTGLVDYTETYTVGWDITTDFC